MNERTVVITGAGGGIGQALCNTFYREGWRVISTDKAQTYSVQAHSHIPIDLACMCTDDKYAQDRMEALRAELPDGELNALINNAAVQIVAPFEDLSVEDWRATVNTNLLAPMLLTKQLLPQLEAARGVVLNVASIHARLTKPRFSAYATSKAGLLGLTRALAVELGGRVRVNAICPAAISTPMLTAGFKHDALGSTTLAECHPSACLGTPREVAEAARYLVCTESPFLSGTILGLDGAIASRLHDPT